MFASDFLKPPAEILDSNISLQFATISSLILQSLWVHPKYMWSRNDFGSPRSTSFMKNFQVGSVFFVLPVSLMSSTHTDKNIPNLKLFPDRVLKELSRIAFPTRVLPLDLPYRTMIWAICVLVDVSSSAWQIQAHRVLRFPILRWVSPLLLSGILQGIAAGIGTSNFLRAALIMSLNSSSSGSMKYIPLNCLALSSFGFSVAHLCFAFFFAASDINFHISGHMSTGRENFCFLVSLLPGPCISFRWPFVQ